MSTPSFDPQPCCPDPVAAFAEEFTTVGLCLGDGTPIGIINRRVAGTIVQDGWVNLLTGTFSVGAPPVGTTACGGALNIQTSDVLCDITTATGDINGLVLIEYHYNPDGSIGSTDIIDATTGASYVPVGTVTVCPTDTGVPDNDMQVLCDRQADGTLIPLIRDYRRDAVGQIDGFSDYTLAGAPYAVTGTVQSCIPRVSTSQVLCDSTPTRFLRTYTYSSSGAVQAFFDTTLAGAPFVPVGAVGTCVTPVPADLDFVEELLCDSNATQFIRRFTIDSVTGAVTVTADLTLAGAPFVPVGAVGICAPVGTANVNVLNTVSVAEPVDVNVLGTVAVAEPVDVNVLNTVSVAEPVDVNVLGTANVHIVDEPIDVNVLNSLTVAQPLNVIELGSTAATATLTTATAVGAGVTVDYANAKSDVTMAVIVTGTVATGVVRLEGSQDGVNWVKLADTAMLATGVNQQLTFSGGAFRWFRGNITETVTGGGTVAATLMFA